MPGWTDSGTKPSLVLNIAAVETAAVRDSYKKVVLKPRLRDA